MQRCQATIQSRAAATIALALQRHAIFVKETRPDRCLFFQKIEMMVLSRFVVALPLRRKYSLLLDENLKVELPPLALASRPFGTRAIVCLLSNKTWQANRAKSCQWFVKRAFQQSRVYLCCFFLFESDDILFADTVQATLAGFAVVEASAKDL